MADGKVTTIHLNETNYNTWKVQCRMVLMREGLWRIVDGTEVEPVDNGLVGQGSNAAAINKYIARKEKALATIVLSIEPSLLYLVGDPQEPSVLWKQLSEQFQKKSWANKLSLRRKLMDLTLNDNEPVKDHIKSMTEIFQELSVVGDHIDDEARVVHLLASLRNHTSFSMLVTALESSPEVPQMELVTERLLHEEKKLKEKAAQADVVNRAFIGRHQGNGSGKKVVRTPQQQKFNGSGGNPKPGNNFQSQGPKCYECGQFGHKKRSCPEFIRKMVEKQIKEQVNLIITREDDDCEVGFVAKEICQAFSMRTMKERLHQWIIDSGASQNMSHDKSLFKNLRKLKDPRGVLLGDGHCVTSEYCGDIVLNVEVEPGIFKKD